MAADVRYYVTEEFAEALRYADADTVAEWLDEHAGDAPSWLWHAVKALEIYALEEEEDA